MGSRSMHAPKRLQRLFGAEARSVADGVTYGLTAPLSTDVWVRLTQAPITAYHDEAAAKIIGHLLRHNCDYQIVRGLVHAWNSAWCKPPLGYRELDRVIERIADREADRILRELAR